MARTRKKATSDTNSEQPSANQSFRPSEFMRARRPELFSDSSVIREQKLSREVFDHHLEPLTSRKEETVFEYFARRLAEKEICPNLLPQTGPTGGGDSKVDSETYPVAEDVALRWYEGLEGSNRERWAFAFSAKKQWRAKVQSDVKKISETGRDYKNIFFISNQYIKDKDRADVEASLQKTYEIPVHILDRTWIITSVFERGRMTVAIETLNLKAFDELEHKVLGPLDFQRESELKSLDEQIADSDRYQGVDYQLGEDCLQSALQARALEHPRAEIEARFLRAERIAERLDHRQQQLRVAYKKAWTAFWWYEDYETLDALYDQIENLAISSQQANDLELLANVWSLVMQSIKRGHFNSTSAKFIERTNTLKSELQRLGADGTRPNTALQAQTHLLLIELPEAVGDPKRLDAVLVNLGEIIRAAEGLTAYPLDAIALFIRSLVNVFVDSAAYDKLFETLISVTERRAERGEIGHIPL